MTIGPEAANSAPGRIVVTIAYFFMLGALAIVAGVGPLVVPSAVEAQLLGAVSCACGAMLVAGGIGLTVRARTGRRTAGWAGRAALLLSVIGLIIGSATLIAAVERPVDSPSAIAGAIVLVGSLGNGLVAMATLRAIHTTRPRYFKGEVTPVCSMRRHGSTDASAEHRATTIREHHAI